MLNKAAVEKFFLKHRKVTTWKIGLLLIIAVLGLVGFGALVEHAATDSARAPAIAELSLRIARIPANTRRTIKHMLSNERPMQAIGQRFEGQAGFTRFKAGDDEALLLARFDGDESRSIVEILDLQNGAVLHRYAPDIQALNRRSHKKAEFVDLSRDRNLQRYPINHPYLTDDGGLIFHGMSTPLVKIDVCSNVVWMIDGFFHHSIERDADGNFWTASDRIPPQLPNVTQKGRDDTLVQFSPDGDILFEKSVGEILFENELGHIVYSARIPDDPIHINDIQPVLIDGPFWRRGDIFLSLRHSSEIIHYRPSTNAVIWRHQGPWMRQHDVDVLGDHRIIVFNNNAALLPWGESVIGVNDAVVYDFATDEISRPFSKGFEINDIRTISEGLSEALPDGEIFVEEQNYGRLLKMNASGEVTWQYVNRASDGRNYVVNWSRYINGDMAQTAAALAAGQCDKTPGLHSTNAGG